MVTPSNKPRDIKNLKARLGRTITPGQTGTPGGAFPGGAPGGLPGSVPPPLVGGGFPGAPSAGAGQPSGGLPAPASSPFGRPLPAPNAGGRSPLGNTGSNPLVPTPNASGAPAAPAPRASNPGAAPRVDPFAAASGAVAAPKRVTLVIDDSAVKDDEIGRRSRGKVLAIVIVCVLLGLGAGYGVGSTTASRGQYKMAVRDGKEIYSRIQEVQKSVETAKDLLKRAVDASSVGPGKKATVDFGAIEQLVALKRPFSANEFHRRLYRAFGNGVVDELFDYYNNINLLWDGFTSLGAKTAGQGRHDALTKSAAATDGLLNTDYGFVLAKNGEHFQAGLVFMNIPPQTAAAEPAAKPDKKAKKGAKGKVDADAIKVKVSSSQGGQEVERNLYTGQPDVAESFEKYAFMVDKVRSRTILGENANLFAKFRGDLMDLNSRMEKTAEVQGRLIKDLSPIAAMSE